MYSDSKVMLQLEVSKGRLNSATKRPPAQNSVHNRGSTGSMSSYSSTSSSLGGQHWLQPESSASNYDLEASGIRSPFSPFSSGSSVFSPYSPCYSDESDTMASIDYTDYNSGGCVIEFNETQQNMNEENKKLQELELDVVQALLDDIMTRTRYEM